MRKRRTREYEYKRSREVVLLSTFLKSFVFSTLSDLTLMVLTKKCSMLIIEQKIMQILYRSRIDKTSRLNEISNRILKKCVESLTNVLTILFQTCITHTYHSRAFRAAHTITLKKFEKNDYITTKIYRLIALLNTLRKMLKSIIVTKIDYLTKHHELLFESQMRERRDKFTKTALKLLTKQIHTV